MPSLIGNKPNQVPSNGDLGTLAFEDKVNYNTNKTSNVIEVTDNSNAALRITQLGTGNALLVEDSANPDSSPFVIDSSGKVIVGYTQSIQRQIETHITTANVSDQGFGSYNWGNNAAGGSIGLYKARGATFGTQTIVNSGDLTGRIDFFGSDGTTFIRSASIQGNIDGTPDTNDMPGRLTFLTTADGASSPTERMRIDSSGNVGIGATANASAILDVQSTTKGVRMPNMTTTQKNAIASPAAGLMVFDTTLAKLCVYTGAAWQTITSV